MFTETLRQLLADVQSGATSADEAVAILRRLPFTQAGDALVDHHRALRSGTPEAIYGPGKSPEQCATIVAEMLKHGEGPVILTRVDDAQAKAALADNPGAQRASNTYAWRLPDPSVATAHRVLVISAGTADVPVVDEAMLTLRAYGFDPDRLTDVGVAGLHRLLAHVDRVTSAEAVVVVAGMEGALASVVGGLTGAPVVAVPTSVGYGAGLDGVTALLAMHATCASGVAVVGIDNGFGAACAALRIVGARR